MYKVLFLTLHRPNRSPSQRFRFEQYIDFLEDNGFQCDWSYLIDAEDDKVFYKPGKHFAKLGILIKSIRKRRKEIKSSEQYDIVFVQRECFMLGSTYFERNFAKKSKMIFDFDDSIWMQNVSNANRRLSFLKNPEKTAELIKISDLIFAGNEYLKSYAKQYNDSITIIPTTIDLKEYKRVPIENKDERVCIGWSGSITTIQHFEFAIPALKIIKEKYGDKVKFQVIGDGDYKQEELGIQGIPWQKDSELKDLSAIDIGLMPLPDDEWAKGKCGLKGLQYMAIEIATIMSPVGVNTEIIKQGENGYLASTVEEWVNTISELIDSKELRDRIGKNGRKTVELEYSVEANKQKYLDAFRSLVS